MNVLKIATTEMFPGVFKVKLDGPIDTYTHETLDYYMEKILQSSTKEIILDMQNVNYISSMGVGSLFKMRKFANQHGMKFSIAGLQPQVKMVLDTVQAMPAESIFRDIKEMDDYLDELQKKAKGEGL